MLDSSICSDYHVLEAIRIIKYVILAFKIIIPILLICLGSYEFFKTILNPDTDSMQVRALSFGKRIASAVIIFLIPSIISIVLSIVGNVSDYFATIGACSERATKEYIAELKTAYYAMLNQEEEVEEYEVMFDNTRYLQAKNVTTSSGTISVSEDVLENTVSVIDYFEGHTPYCDDSESSYLCQDIGDGALTVGYGVTNYSMSGLVAGQCYSVETVDEAKKNEVSQVVAVVENEVNALNPSGWDDAKTAAAASISYNCGSSYGKRVVQQYAASGNDGALSVFKSCVHASNGNSAFTEGLKNRRDKEYDLFINGDYSVISQNRSRIYIQ